MGNPHPSRSKPIKIGRKHTGAPGSRQIGRELSGRLKKQKIKVDRLRSYKKEVAEWWAGLREQHPIKPI